MKTEGPLTNGQFRDHGNIGNTERKLESTTPTE
jgi:hypothetical protein